MSGLTAQERVSSTAGVRPPLVHLGSGMKLKSAAIPQLSNARGLISLDVALLQPCHLTCLELKAKVLHKKCNGN